MLSVEQKAINRALSQKKYAEKKQKELKKYRRDYYLSNKEELKRKRRERYALQKQNGK